MRHLFCRERETARSQVQLHWAGEDLLCGDTVGQRRWRISQMMVDGLVDFAGICVIALLFALLTLLIRDMTGRNHP